MEVTRVDDIRVPVDDIEAARRFYGGVLGLPRNEHLDHEILLHHRYEPYES